MKNNISVHFFISGSLLLSTLALLSGCTPLEWFKSKTGLQIKKDAMNISMIDHLQVYVKNFEQSLNFYDITLKKLNYERIMTFPEKKVAGYGRGQKPYFWITEKESELKGVGYGLHFAFLAENIEQIHEWYKTCLENGGTSNGEPGPRPIYHPGYYGAFIIDPNGWRIEACLHNYQSKSKH